MQLRHFELVEQLSVGPDAISYLGHDSQRQHSVEIRLVKSDSPTDRITRWKNGLALLETLPRPAYCRAFLTGSTTRPPF